MSRAFTDVLASIRGAARFGDKAGIVFDFGAAAHNLSATATALGLTVSGSGIGTSFGETMPSKTDLVAALIGLSGEDADYSLLSGWAHGEAWALADTLQFGADMPVSLPWDHCQYIATVAGRGFVNAVERAVYYFGWAEGAWRVTTQRCFDAIGKTP